MSENSSGDLARFIAFSLSNLKFKKLLQLRDRISLDIDSDWLICHPPPNDDEDLIYDSYDNVNVFSDLLNNLSLLWRVTLNEALLDQDNVYKNHTIKLKCIYINQIQVVMDEENQEQGHGQGLGRGQTAGDVRNLMTEEDQVQGQDHEEIAEEAILVIGHQAIGIVVV